MKSLSVFGLALFLCAAQATKAQQESPALADFLVRSNASLVYVETTKILPNGAMASFHGTGFVVSSIGQVLTAAHVVDGIARETLGKSYAGEINPKATFSYRGKLASSEAQLEDMQLDFLDDSRDLAILHFKKRGHFKPLEIASGANLRSPEQILALGFPLTMSSVVPALGRITGTGQPDGRWLIDAPVNPGHSGGPVIRRDGRVVGVVHAGIQGATLMNLILPFSPADPLLVRAGIAQVPDDNLQSLDVIPMRSNWDDIRLEGSCEERRSIFEKLAEGIRWACAEGVVSSGGSPNVERTQNVRVSIPASAAIMDVRYFHRSRGDWHDPVESGDWHTNPPDSDLQWMEINKAQIQFNGTSRIVEARCRNWSHNLRMFCAIGVQYREGVWLW